MSYADRLNAVLTLVVAHAPEGYAALDALIEEALGALRTA